MNDVNKNVVERSGVVRLSERAGFDARAMLTGVQSDEPAAVKARYARRRGDDRRYSLLVPAAMLADQERQRAIADLFVGVGRLDLTAVRLLEVGCGTGSDLLEFIRLGFKPEHLQGIELLTERAERARANLPSSVRITLGDAAGAATSFIPEASQDIVYQATVFSSLLDNEFQERLADTMWYWLRPGGGILWYDFTVNNPQNPDVRGVPLKRIRQLFPHGKMRVRRLTLAPPLARIVTRIHPKLYTALNLCRWLRTHVLVWIEKPLAVCFYLVGECAEVPFAVARSLVIFGSA